MGENLADIVGLLRSWDHRLFFAINGLSSSILDPILGWTTTLGNFFVLLILIFFGCWIGDRRGIIKAYPWIFFAIGGARMASQLLKEWIHRPRPSFYFADEIRRGSAEIYTLFGPYDSQNSFPSGHATVVFAAVTALCLLYGKKWRMLYGIAALVALSRVYVGAHFPSDALAGAVLGSGAAWAILRFRTLSIGVFLDKKN